MNSESSLFVMKDKQFFDNTPYFKVNIEINNNINSTITVGLVVNSLTGQVNLTKLFQDLQNGVRNAKKNFKDWKCLIDMMKYVDCYSLMKYGHFHYYYENEPIYVLNTDEDEDGDNEPPSLDNIKNLKIKSDLTNKGKIVKTTLITEAPEIFGEIYNGFPNECKGQYGDYHLITKMMSYISFNYEIINNDFVAFILPILSNDKSNMIKEMNKPEDKIMIALDESIPDESIIKKTIFDDEELSNIMKINNSTKGKLAERWTEKYMKKWIPDITSCADIPESCDLYSDVLKMRVEIKCRNDYEKTKTGMDKFHRDVKVHEKDTNMFIYLDLCRNSHVISHFEINPLRLYLNGEDLNEKMMNFIKSTCENYNKNIISEYSGEIRSNILLKSARKEFEEGMKELRKEYVPKVEDFINEIMATINKAKQETKTENDAHEERDGDGDDESKIIKEKEMEIKMTPGISKTRLEKYANTVKDFVEANKDKFGVGYYVSKSYNLYLDWCKVNLRQTLLRKEFDLIMKNLCDNRRISTDPYENVRNNLHYWVMK